MLPPSFYVRLRFYSSYASYALASTRARLFSSASSCRHHTAINYREYNSSERANTRTASRIIVHIRVRILSTSTALLLLSECTTILPAKSIRDTPAVWSVCLLFSLLYCLLLRVLCGLVRSSYAVVFALLFQVSKWVSGCVVLEAVRVVHVIICKCVMQRGVAVVEGVIQSDRES